MSLEKIEQYERSALIFLHACIKERERGRGGGRRRERERKREKEGDGGERERGGERF